MKKVGVKEIIAQWLDDNGYTGFYCSQRDCSCTKEELCCNDASILGCYAIKEDEKG